MSTSRTQRKFLARLQGEITKRGTIDVVHDGVKHGAHHLDLFYGTPSLENEKAKLLYAANRFSVTRQLRYEGRFTRRTSTGSIEAITATMLAVMLAESDVRQEIKKKTMYINS